MAAPAIAAPASPPARLAEVLDKAISELRSQLQTDLESEFVTPLQALRAENAQLREQLYAAAALPLGGTSSASSSATQLPLNPVAGSSRSSDVFSADTPPDEAASPGQDAGAANSCVQSSAENACPMLLPLSQAAQRSHQRSVTMPTVMPSSCPAGADADADADVGTGSTRLRGEGSLEVSFNSSGQEEEEDQSKAFCPTQSNISSRQQGKVGLLNVPDSFRGHGGGMKQQKSSERSPRGSLWANTNSRTRASCGNVLSHRSTVMKPQPHGTPHPQDLADDAQTLNELARASTRFGSLDSGCGVSPSSSGLFSVMPNKVPAQDADDQDDSEESEPVCDARERLNRKSCSGGILKARSKQKQSIFSTDGSLLTLTSHRDTMHPMPGQATGQVTDSPFLLHGTWAEKSPVTGTSRRSPPKKGSSLNRSRSHLSSARYESSPDNDSEASAELVTSSNLGCCTSLQQRYMVQPNSLRRLTWEFMGMALILWDIIWIPFLLFEPGDSIFSEMIGWVARIFWTFDIPASFVTGYITQEGILEMRGNKVSIRYMRTRLPFDLLLVFCDWIEATVRTTASFLSTARVGKVLRTFRVLRMIRLARLLKLPGLMDMITERIFSEKVVLLMNIVKSTLCIIVYAHVIACFWYKLGSMQDHNWLEEYEYSDKMLGLKYAVSLHWSMARFIGEPPVMSTNLAEHCYAIFSLILSFVMSAAFVSSITTSMTRLQIIGVEEQNNFTILRRYLRIQAVSTKLAMRITRNARFAVKQQKARLIEDDVVLFQLLSEPLMIELHYEVYARVLRAHPVFELYCLSSPHAMRKVCHTSVLVLHISKGDILFHAGERPDHGHMLMLMNGKMNYDKDTNEKQPVEEHSVNPGQWVCEMVLWASWIHCGTLQAETECSLLALSSEKFQYVGQRYFDTDEDIHPAAYARWYVAKMSKLSLHEMTDLDPGFGLSNQMKMAMVALTAGADGGWTRGEKKQEMKVSFAEAPSDTPGGLQIGRKSRKRASVGSEASREHGQAADEEGEVATASGFISTRKTFG